MNKEENDALDDLSARSGLSKANVLRKLILSNQSRRSPARASFHSPMPLAGVNFNQPARRVNRPGTVSDSDIKEAQRVYNRVRCLMREWEKTRR